MVSFDNVRTDVRLQIHVSAPQGHKAPPDNLEFPGFTFERVCFPVIQRLRVLVLALHTQDEMRQLVRILVKIMPNSINMLAVEEEPQGQNPDGSQMMANQGSATQGKEGSGNKVRGAIHAISPAHTRCDTHRVPLACNGRALTGVWHDVKQGVDCRPTHAWQDVQLITCDLVEYGFSKPSV